MSVDEGLNAGSPPAKPLFAEIATSYLIEFSDEKRAAQADASLRECGAVIGGLSVRHYDFAKRHLYIASVDSEGRLAHELFQQDKLATLADLIRRIDPDAKARKNAPAWAL